MTNDDVSSGMPDSIRRGMLSPETTASLEDKNLRLGGKESFTDERRHHIEVLAVAPPEHLAHVYIEPLVVLGGPVSDFNARYYQRTVAAVLASAKNPVYRVGSVLCPATP